MAARYATVSFSAHITATNKDVSVCAGALRDSTDPVVVQLPQFFDTSPPVYGELPPATVGYLLANPAGP